MVRILITGANGGIASYLSFFIASGLCLKNEDIELVLFDLPQFKDALYGLKLELVDCNYPHLKSVTIAEDLKQAFSDLDFAILVGSMPRGPGMDRADLLKANAKIFVEQGRAMDQYGSKNMKVLVVGNPANTNCLIAMKNAPSIPSCNFQALSRLDHNRLRAQVCEKLSISDSQLKNAAVWGNHSDSMVPDLSFSTFDGKNVIEAINDDIWIDEILIPRVQKRGGEIIKWRGRSSAASAANAVVDAIRDWHFGTTEGNCVSCSIYSKGNPYNVDEDLIFSFPCHIKNGKIEIVKNLEVSQKTFASIENSAKELIHERELAFSHE